MGRRTLTSRPGWAPVAATLIALGLVAGSTPAAAVSAGTLGGDAGVTGAIAPGLRAELLIAGPDPTSTADDRIDRAPLVGLESIQVGGTQVEDPSRSPSRTPSPSSVRPKPAHASPRPRQYGGTNRVWSEAFGLNRSVVWFSCSRSRPPDMAVYRWGCAGPNNVYLFAHAGGSFRRLHDLYVRGGLRRGMTVTYADARGSVHRYRVAWWKVVLPTNGDFAFAAQSRPSMTLQTCVGQNDRYRLVVRLYQSD